MDVSEPDYQILYPYWVQFLDNVPETPPETYFESECATEEDFDLESLDDDGDNFDNYNATTLTLE